MNSPGLFIGLRYMFSRRRSRSVSFISAIAMTGIVLGVALLITVLSVMNGFDRELRERILGIMPHITLYERGGMVDWAQNRERIFNLGAVEGIAPFVELEAMLTTGKHTQPILVYGVHGELEPSVSRIDRYLPQAVLQDLNQTANGIALGRDLADKLAINKGDTLTLLVPKSSFDGGIPSIARVTVLALYDTDTELDQKLVLMGLRQAASLSPAPEAVTGLHLRTFDLFSAPRIATKLRRVFDINFYTTDWTRTHGNIYYAIQMSKNLVGILLFLIIAIAAFNVVSTLVMVVVDRQSDIAILRTLGLSTGGIKTVFIVQGSLIGFVGTLSGVVLGIIFALSVEGAVEGLEGLLGIEFLKTDIYPISFLPSSLQLNDVIMVASVAIVMSILSTLYPAIKAARVQPAAALRYD